MPQSGAGHLHPRCAVDSLDQADLRAPGATYDHDKAGQDPPRQRGVCLLVVTVFSCCQVHMEPFDLPLPGRERRAVSYTHLTLPTILRV